MLAAALLLAVAAVPAMAFDPTRFDNMAVYWGQNSYGAVNSADTANWQKTLSYYCQDSSVDIIPIAFIDVFFSTGGLPQLNLASTCNPTDNATFPGTALANCQALASDIQFCQSKGKALTISLGGAGGGVGFQSAAQATTMADEIWNLFLGGSSSTRPFGSAVLDGVDLDIESGSNLYYDTFVTRIRSHTNGASKPYYITAAPQCPNPDASLQAALNAVGFDAVYVQFYNNQCGLQAFNSGSWNFGSWDFWARNTSPNKNVKVYLGAPASSTAGGDYVSAATLSSYATAMRQKYPSFGGVMLWDASQAWANGRFQATVKAALVAAGGTGFTYPACSAPAWASGASYSAGQQVTYQGYIYQAKWYASDTPNTVFTGDWQVVSACGGAPISSSSSKSTSTSPTSTKPTTTSTPTTSTKTTTSPTTTSSSGGGNCAGVSAWSASVAYTGGSTVTYGGSLWKAAYWTEADTPGGSAGVWTNLGSCTSQKRAYATGLAVVTEDAKPRAGSRFFNFKQ